MLCRATKPMKFQSQTMFTELSLRSRLAGYVKCHSYLKKRQEGGFRELQAYQPHLNPSEGNGTTTPGNHFQILERHGNDQQ